MRSSPKQNTRRGNKINPRWNKIGRTRNATNQSIDRSLREKEQIEHEIHLGKVRGGDFTSIGDDYRRELSRFDLLLRSVCGGTEGNLGWWVIFILSKKHTHRNEILGHRKLQISFAFLVNCLSAPLLWFHDAVVGARTRPIVS